MKNLILSIVFLFTVNLMTANNIMLPEDTVTSTPTDTAKLIKVEAKFGTTLLIVGAGAVVVGAVIASAPVTVVGGLIFVFSLGLRSNVLYIDRKSTRLN